MVPRRMCMVRCDHTRSTGSRAMNTTFGLREAAHDPRYLALGERRVVGRDVAGQEAALQREEAGIGVEVGPPPGHVHIGVEEVDVALVEGRSASLRLAAVGALEALLRPPAEIHRGRSGRGPAVEIVELLDRRHPEIRVKLELVVEPARAAFLGADAEEVGTAVRVVGKRPRREPPALAAGLRTLARPWPSPDETASSPCPSSAFRRPLPPRALTAPLAGLRVTPPPGCRRRRDSGGRPRPCRRSARRR